MVKKLVKYAALALGLAGAGMNSAMAEEDPIRIGSFLSVTGKGAFLGDPSKKVLEHFVKQKNAEGGLLGRKIELVLYDSRTDAKEAVNFVRRLTSQDKVDIIIGGNTTGETMAVAPFVTQAKTPFISLGGGSVIIDPVKPWVFKTVHTDRISVQRILEAGKAKGYAKVAVLSGAGGFDQSCRKNALELVPSYDMELSADEQHGAGDTDMTAQMTNIRGTHPDMLIYCGFGAPTSIVAKNHAQLAKDISLYMTVGAASDAFIAGAGGAAEGVYVTGSAVMVADQLSADHAQAAVSQDFVREYSAAFGEAPSSFAGHAFDGLLVALNAIERAGSTDADAIRTALEGTSGVPGINGVYEMSAEDHMGLGPNSLILVKVSNGKFVLAD